jgi:hypothetical protein
MVVSSKFYGVCGIRTSDLPTGQVFAKSSMPTRHMVFLVIHICLNLFKLKLLCMLARGSGWGLAPARGLVYYAM